MGWDGRAIIESLPEIYYMLDNDRVSDHPFRKYELLKEYFGEKKYKNMIDSVKSIKETDLSTFIQAQKACLPSILKNHYRLVAQRMIM